MESHAVAVLNAQWLYVVHLDDCCRIFLLDETLSSFSFVVALGTEFLP
jgi:hypothetical protein